MEDWKPAIRFLQELVGELDAGCSVSEKAALLGGATVLLDGLSQVVKDHYQDNSYAREKIHKARWSILAALELDTTNGHDSEQHRSWARGELNTLESVLSKSPN